MPLIEPKRVRALADTAAAERIGIAGPSSRARLDALPTAIDGRLPLATVRVAELDGLRGLAILSVVIWHYVAGAIPATPGSLQAYLLLPLSMTYTGVNLFFVLSGFLIGGILLDNRGSSSYFRAFYIRRFFRIIPLYYTVLFVLAILLIFQQLYNATMDLAFGTVEPFATYLLFVQNIAMVLHGAPVNSLSHTWSLAVEEQFYLTLPLTIWLLTRRQLVALGAMLIAISPWVRTWGGNVPLLGLVWNFDALYFGVLIAVLVRTPHVWAWFTSRGYVSTVFFAITAVLMALCSARVLRPGDWQSSLVAISYACLLLAVLVAPNGIVSRIFRWAPLRQLGMLCFGVYLIHIPMLLICHAAIGRGREYPMLMDGLSIAASCAALGLTLALASASWRWLEKPMIRRGHHWRY